MTIIIHSNDGNEEGPHFYWPWAATDVWSADQICNKWQEQVRGAVLLRAIWIQTKPRKSAAVSERKICKYKVNCKSHNSFNFIPVKCNSTGVGSFLCSHCFPIADGLKTRSETRTIILFNKNIGVESPPHKSSLFPVAGWVRHWAQKWENVYLNIWSSVLKSRLFSHHIAIPCWGCWRLISFPHSILPFLPPLTSSSSNLRRTPCDKVSAQHPFINNTLVGLVEKN